MYRKIATLFTLKCNLLLNSQHYPNQKNTANYKTFLLMYNKSNIISSRGLYNRDVRNVAPGKFIASWQVDIPRNIQGTPPANM